MTNWLEEARALGCDTHLTGEGTMYTFIPEDPDIL